MYVVCGYEVYQFAGVGHELGSALVPSVNCTGSTSVSFSRIYNDLFVVQIMTQKKNLNSFEKMDPELLDLNENKNEVKWHRVDGSVGAVEDETWYAAVINMDKSASTDIIYTIKNKGLFHLSVLDANGKSMSYGYFSSFNNLRIDGPTMACVGEDIVLTTAQAASTLTWFYDDGINGKQKVAEDKNKIIAQKEGEYWVEQAFQGCFATDRINVKFNQPKFSLGGDREECYDPTNPEITITADSIPLGADYTYQWGSPYESDTTNMLTFTPTPGETYNFSLTATTTDDLKCQYTEEAEIIVKSIPVVTWNLPSGQEEICLGEIIALEDSIALENIQSVFTYQWYLDGEKIDGANSSYYQPTSASQSGTYTVHVTTSENCTVIESRPITVNPNPTVNIEDTAECPRKPHTYSLSGYSTYEWYDALNPSATLGTNRTITLNHPISEFVVKVSNAAGCFATDTAEFKWHNQHVFTFGADTTLCEGMDMTIEIDAHFIDYKWKFNNVDISTGSNPTANDHLLEFSKVDYTVSGIYSITAQDNINGCPVSGDFNLEVLPPVEFKLDYDDKNGKICDGDSIRLIPIKDNGRKFTTFNWSKQNPVTSSWEEIPIANGGGQSYLIVRDPGNFKLEAIQDNNCSAVSQPLSVDVIDSPTFRFEDVEACPGKDLILVIEDYRNTSGDSVGVFSHAVWYNFSGGANDTIKIMNSNEEIPKKVEEGNQTVTVYDILGCFATLDASADYKPTPNITLEDASFCDGEGYDLTLSTTALGIEDYFWTKESNIVTESTVFEGGIYTLTITTLDECDIVADSMELRALPSPIATLRPELVICEGESISIKTERDHRAYQWYHEGDTITGGTNASITPVLAGEYSVQVIAKNGCEAMDTTQVTIHKNPIVNIGPDETVCPGESVIRTIFEDFQRIAWSSGEVNFKRVRLHSGLHTVYVENEFNCVGTAQVTISSHPMPQFSLGEDLILCPTELPVYVEIEGQTEFDKYRWHTGATEKMIQGSIMDTVNILEAKDRNGCWARKSKVINLYPEPDYNFGRDIDECDTDVELIAGDIFSVEDSEGMEEQTDVLTYFWEHNKDTTQIIRVNESRQYLVRASDGCWVKTDTFNVRVHPNPVITGLDTIVYARVTVLTDPDIGTQPFTYTLNNGNPQDDKTFKNVENDEHTVWVEDIHGCTDSTTFQFNSNLDDLEIPNFFTPNGDGVNDRWIIKGLEKVPESDIRIYDRYGKLLIRYQASEIEGWDGTYLNSPVPSDDYWYVIHLKPIDKIVKGNVTIKR